MHYARRSGLEPESAKALLASRFDACRGTMNWYCIDHWSRELGLDVRALKRAVRHEVRYLPGAEQFLRELAQTGKRRILVTNAHPETLAIKSEHVPFAAHFDATHSSHGFAVPKEHPEFWARFSAREPFDPARALFVDDSVPVLAAARDFGIAWLRAVRSPDSGRPPNETADYVAIDGVADLLR